MIKVTVYLSPWEYKNFEWVVPIGTPGVKATLVRPHLIRLEARGVEMVLDRDELARTLAAMDNEVLR